MIWNDLIFCAALLTTTPSAGDTIPLQLTVNQAEQLLQERNPQLRMAQLEVEAAEALLLQEKKWDNPEVSLLYNVYNPITGKYFDASSEGETDIEIGQSIPIGGQRKERIRKQEATVNAATSQQEWTNYQTRMDLHRLMAEVYYLQEKAAVFDTEIHSVERILTAYRRQAEQGNLSHMDVARVEALKLRLVGEQNGFLGQLFERKNDLRLMLCLDETIFVVKFSYPLSDDHPSGSHFPSQLPLSDFSVSSRPDLMALQSLAQAAEHDLKLQKANALPQLGLKAEYDKNGNICHNFFGIGATLTLPLLDRNQGNIKQSKVECERIQIEAEIAQRQANAETRLRYENLMRQQALLEEAQGMSLADWSPETAEKQLLNRNISMLEFIDLYDAWRETQLLIIEARNRLMQAAINLNEAFGKEIISIK
ncbi:MAG: TolC family protein [Bacteroidales bacterium]|nr:TolC family protein [Bacteroidales bacterium]